MKKTLFISLLVVFGVFMAVGSAMATTTIGTNISTGGTLTVTGASTLTGAATFGSNLILQNAETISNSTDGQIDVLVRQLLQVPA